MYFPNFDSYYEPYDDITTEKELNLRCICNKCDFDEYLDKVADVGRSYTTWQWNCPECGAYNEDEEDNEKLFDTHYDD